MTDVFKHRSNIFSFPRALAITLLASIANERAYVGVVTDVALARAFQITGIRSDTRTLKQSKINHVCSKLYKILLYHHRLFYQIGKIIYDHCFILSRCNLYLQLVYLRCYNNRKLQAHWTRFKIPSPMH